MWLYNKYNSYPYRSHISDMSLTLKNRTLTLLGRQIRKLRKEKGFSQESFANFIEMNRGYYGTVERGEANVTVLNLLRIAKGLGVPPGALFPPEIYESISK